MSRVNLDRLVTEKSNPASKDMDLLPTEQLLGILNDEDAKVAPAVRLVIPKIAQIVDACAKRMAEGGRILYMGAGTSARLAYMDAAECPPTFGVSPDLIQVSMAGGKEAVFKAQEKVEDARESALKAVEEWGARPQDCVIGIAASGRTPYVLSGLNAAREKGAFTAFICSNPADEEVADVVVSCITGPEALAGSTRLKAGTAAKMILNMISTCVMIRLGRTYGNHMCYIQGTNGKLASRAIGIVEECCGVSAETAEKALMEAEGSLALALTMQLSGCEKERAAAALERACGNVRNAAAMLLRGEA
ncbi:MAG: N-acetylmuramic acid 6-phosphate etherase [Clostridiales bacterium]|nr:N-acetylmuramic acid 6-phosphate etherase [Clostridiales bacterium]